MGNRIGLRTRRAHPTVPPVTREALPKPSKALFRRPFCLVALPWAHCGQIHAPGRLRPSNQPAAFARLRLPGCEPQSNHAVRELESWAGQSHERATASRSVPILKTLRPKATLPKIYRTTSADFRVTSGATWLPRVGTLVRHPCARRSANARLQKPASPSPFAQLRWLL